MNRNIICIVIALTVLSISAYLIASDVVLIRTVAEVGSDLNGVPIHITIYERARDTHVIKTMSHQELQDNWEEHDRKFIQFIGRVDHVTTEPQTKQVQRLTLKGLTTHVYLLDLMTPPITYEQGQTYQFTGFLIRCETAEPQKKGNVGLRLYAFDIRHVDEIECSEKRRHGDEQDQVRPSRDGD